MSPKEKAEDLVNSFRMVLMNEDTDCGNEILCTCISIDMALITVNEFLLKPTPKQKKYWEEVKNELEKL